MELIYTHSSHARMILKHIRIDISFYGLNFIEGTVSLTWGRMRAKIDRQNWINYTYMFEEWIRVQIIKSSNIEISIQIRSYLLFIWHFNFFFFFNCKRNIFTRHPKRQNICRCFLSLQHQWMTTLTPTVFLFHSLLLFFAHYDGGRGHRHRYTCLLFHCVRVRCVSRSLATKDFNTIDSYEIAKQRQRIIWFIIRFPSKFELWH